jgi:peptidoglycan hydrolase-like protein with peptidoglycan-binding domain
MGMRGDDVAEFQAELNRLGFEVAADGYYSYSMYLAVLKFWKGLGQKSQGALPLSQIVWLGPEYAVTADSCIGAIGDLVSPRDVVFTSGGGIEYLEVALPNAAVKGARVAANDSGAGAVIEEGNRITDAAFLREFEMSKAYQAWKQDESTTLVVGVRLADPINVFPVPPSALFAVTAGKGCVETGNGPVAVEIVASEFGATLVHSERELDSVFVPPRDAEEPCG